MAVFVINEWLWADACGDNPPPAQSQALDIVVSLGNSEHQIVVIERSPFDQKAWACCKHFSTVARHLAGIYVATIRLNSDRCRLLTAEDVVALPDDLASSIPADDQYLVQAQRSVDGAVLVTTDRTLQQAMLNAGLPCLLREEFLAGYIHVGE